MYKTKLFFGSFSRKPADEKFNEWIKDNSNIEILSFKYKQAKYGDHSICILYKEKDK